MTLVHPTAIVDPRARLASGVEIGPYAVIGEHVELASGVVIGFPLDPLSVEKSPVFEFSVGGQGF